MGRNKRKATLTKAEKKLQKDGRLTTTTEYGGKQSSTPGLSTVVPNVRDPDLARPRSYRTRLDTKRQSQTSNNSWLHGALFLVLAAIVISWALGY